MATQQEESFSDPCPICTDDMNLEENQPLITLSCGHRFCQCGGQVGIKVWAEKTQACPLCKQVIIPTFDFAEPPIAIQDDQQYNCPATSCTTTLQGSELRQHFKEEHQIKTCGLCHKGFQKHLLNKHKGQCQKRWSQCPAGDCTEVIPFDVKISIIRENPKTTKLSYEGEEYSSAAEYLKKDHDCQHLKECLICKRVYRDHDSLAAHCSHQHPQQIDEALPSKKRKAALLCDQNVIELRKLGKQFRKELRNLKKTVAYIPRTSSSSPPSSPMSQSEKLSKALDETIKQNQTFKLSFNFSFDNSGIVKKRKLSQLNAKNRQLKL